MEAPKTKEINVGSAPADIMAMFAAQQRQGPRSPFSPTAPNKVESKGELARTYNFADRNNARSDERLEARTIRQEGRALERELDKEDRVHQRDLIIRELEKEDEIEKEIRKENEAIRTSNQKELSDYNKEKREEGYKIDAEKRLAKRQKQQREAILKEQKQLLKFKENLPSIKSKSEQAKAMHDIKMKEVALNIAKLMMDAKVQLVDGDMAVENLKSYKQIMDLLDKQEKELPIETLKAALGMGGEAILEALQDSGSGLDFDTVADLMTYVGQDANKAREIMDIMRGDDDARADLSLAESQLANKKEVIESSRLKLMNMRGSKMTEDGYEQLREAVKEFTDFAGQIDMNAMLKPTPPSTQVPPAPSSAPSSSPNNPVSPMSPPSTPSTNSGPVQGANPVTPPMKSDGAILDDL